MRQNAVYRRRRAKVFEVIETLYQALYRKWRPRTFDDVAGQGHITDILRSQVQSGRLSHAYLFTGTRGTGKTTCAKILSRAVNCLHPENGNPCNKCEACLGIENGSIMDVLEIDAASNNGVDNVRALRDEAVFTPASVRMRVYIIDEVHMLTGPAFNALLKILEEPPKHLLFILATTEVHKVPATVLSRCQRFAFKRITPADIAARLAYIASSEGIDLTEDAARILAGLSDGALRDAISLLDQCAASGGLVDTQRVHDVIGLAGQDAAAEIIRFASVGDTAGALALFERIYESGAEVTAVMDELSVLCRDLLIRKTTKNAAASASSYFWSGDLQALMKSIRSERLLDMLSLIRECQSRARYSTDRRVDAELCIMRMSLAAAASQENLLPRIERIEQLLGDGPVVHNVREESAVDEPAEKAAESEKLVRFSKEPDDPEQPEPESPSQTQPTIAAESLPECASAAQADPAGDFDWFGTLEKAKAGIHYADYTTLLNPTLVCAKRAGDMLHLYAENDFVAMRLGDQKLQAALKDAAGAVKIEITVGLPSREEDRFGKLLSLKGKFDNIKVE